MISSNFVKKYPQIPTLLDYNNSPPPEFWDKFPARDLPKTIFSKANPDVIEKLTLEKSKYLTEGEIEKSKLIVSSLKNGGDSCQKTPLPACFVKNASSAICYGENVTDAIAHWLVKGFASGPFNEPPLPEFRVNPIMAIPQGEKVRPVLNVSAPLNASFNSNVDKEKLEKLKMSTAKDFSYAILEAGINCTILKYDMCDAYKNVPAPICDLRLQGFKWLNKFFVETRQIFGARTAPANFDVLGSTILSLAVSNTDIPSKFVHRTLDDVPFVSPEKKNWDATFVSNYEKICNLVGIDLAPNCPNFEKAFGPSNMGKVLGIFFDTTTLSWKLPVEKIEKTLRAISKIEKQKSLSLLDFQKMMGSLNNIAIMFPFLQGFKFNLNKVLSVLLSSDSDVVLSNEARNDLNICYNIVSHVENWTPIAFPKCAPPLSHLYFTSDAAGCSDNTILENNIGCGNIGFNYDGIIIFAKQIFWEKETILKARDENLKRIGNKTTFLEFVGILLPFVCCPSLVSGKHIIVKVDNIGCFYGWLNKHCAGDELASIAIRTLHLLAAFLSCEVHIEHLPRVSSWDAMLADRLSRERTTTFNDLKLLNSFPVTKLPDSLTQWLKSPEENWNVPFDVLNEIKLLL